MRWLDCRRRRYEQSVPGSCRSRVPSVGDLVERLFAEFLARPGDRAAAEGTVEFYRRFVVRQRPHDEAANPALGEVAPRRREQPATEAEALEFRPQVKLVDLAVI